MNVYCRKILILLCVTFLFSGTVVTASTAYNIHLVAQQSKITNVVKKQNDKSAYVSREGGENVISSIATVNMCNSSGIRKSAIKDIDGVGHVYLSYDGYGVRRGDYIALKAYNNASKNGGRSIDVTGVFIP